MNATELARQQADFSREYAAHRASEGRGFGPAEAMMLPYLVDGPLERQWQVKARSYDALLARIITPLAQARGRALSVLDIGAGNGWLAYRLATKGHFAFATDVRDDHVDGLGAGSFYAAYSDNFHRASASFDMLPFRQRSFDVAVFNASIHYSLALRAVLAEASRVVRSGGRLVIMDSPFYTREESGRSMVAEKRSTAHEVFGDRAKALTSLPFIEFLTAPTLATASSPLGLVWRRHRVLYPFWYELRPIVAKIRGRREPSRFDVWEAIVP